MDIFALMQQIQDAVVDLASSPWVLLVLFACCFIDGFFPPVPSEAVVMSLAALSVTGNAPHLALIMIVAAVGALCGDIVAFAIGRRMPVRRLKLFRTGRGAAALDWAEGQLERRGGSLILSARYVPIGRIAVNVSAGAAGYPFRKFLLFAIIAGLSWGAFSGIIGAGAGAVLHEHPILGVIVGIALGLTLGALLDAALRRIEARRFAGSASSAADAESDEWSSLEESRTR